MAVYPHIVTTPGVCFGKPRIEGTRIKVQFIVERILHGHCSVEQMLKDYPQLSPAQIHAALAYYYDHRDEIDRHIRESEDRVRAMEPSAIRAGHADGSR